MHAIQKILKSMFTSLISFFSIPDERDALESYLSNATDACDVEIRQRTWERRGREHSIY